MEATKMSLWYVASFPLDQYQAWLHAAHFGQDMARVDTSFAHLSRAFREPFARNRKKKKRYYLLSGLSRIFRKPFANVYISRKVPFAQTFQIYARGPRLYKTFHGFLHDSHILRIVFHTSKNLNICKRCRLQKLLKITNILHISHNIKVIFPCLPIRMSSLRLFCRRDRHQIIQNKEIHVNPWNSKSKTNRKKWVPKSWLTSLRLYGDDTSHLCTDVGRRKNSICVYIPRSINML